MWKLCLVKRQCQIRPLAVAFRCLRAPPETEAESTTFVNFTAAGKRKQPLAVARQTVLVEFASTFDRAMQGLLRVEADSTTSPVPQARHPVQTSVGFSNGLGVGLGNRG